MQPWSHQPVITALRLGTGMIWGLMPCRIGHYHHWEDDKYTMEEHTHPVAKVLAILFSILFVITGVIAILMFNATKLAFDPGMYKQALSSTGIYERIARIARGTDRVFIEP